MSVFLFVSTFLGLVVTSGDYGLTWDEPVYMEGVDKLGGWFRQLGHGDLRQAFSEEAIREAWVFARRDNRNLPVPVLVSLVGRGFGRWLAPPSSYRVGGCFLMAASAAFLFLSLARRRGALAGLAGAGALVLDPPLFAHGHVAATDTPVSCFFILAIAFWLESVNRSRGVWACGLACGLGLASKASFLFFPGVLLLWLLLFGNGAAWWRALVVGVMSVVLMMVLCPMWWSHPLAAPAAYLSRVVHAGERWQVDAYYLGKAYTETLPWHSGFVLTAVTTPPLTLALALVGGLIGIWRRDPETTMWVFGALALPVSRLIPGAPAHDVNRLLLPTLYCLAPLAGIGFFELGKRLPLRLLRALALVPVLAFTAWPLVRMHPFEMSYYSEAIGGLPGAARLGFEVSYWFDAFTPEAREEIQGLLPRGSRVWTAPRYPGYPRLRQWGLWRSDIAEDEDNPQYLILYSRRGYITQMPTLASIEKTDTPLWSLNLQGVPLVRLFQLPKQRS